MADFYVKRTYKLVTLDSMPSVSELSSTDNNMSAPLPHQPLKAVPRAVSHATPKAADMPVAPTGTRQLTKVMSALRDGLKSPQAAAQAMKRFRNCVVNHTNPAFQQVRGICVHNAKVLAEHFPALRQESQVIATAGSSYIHNPSIVAPFFKGVKKM
jgi:hypothetical protein